MINLYVSLKELNVLYHKRDIEIATKPPTLFRVRTGLKYGDCYEELDNECTEWCVSEGQKWGTIGEVECECFN